MGRQYRLTRATLLVSRSSRLRHTAHGVTDLRIAFVKKSDCPNVPEMSPKSDSKHCLAVSWNKGKCRQNRRTLRVVNHMD